MSDLLERFGREAKAGEVLFQEGDPGDSMFVIQGGTILLTRNVAGESVEVARLGAGEFLGEMAIVNHKPRTATATVVEDAQLLVLGTKTFEAMIRANTEIAVRMVMKLASRLDSTIDQYDALLAADNQRRVGLVLLSGGRETLVSDVAPLTGLDETAVEDVLADLEARELITREAGVVTYTSDAELTAYLLR